MSIYDKKDKGLPNQSSYAKMKQFMKKDFTAKSLLEIPVEKVAPQTTIHQEYVAPGNEIEIKLHNLFRTLLKVEQIGVNDNFFDLGGNSLKAIDLIARIYKEFAVNVTLSEFFDKPSLSQLAEHLQNAEKVMYAGIEEVESSEFYRLSSAQNRMYILNQMEKERLNYNLTSVMVIEGKLDLKRFEQTFNSLVNRHDALRTWFEMVDGTPVQKIHPHLDLHIDLLEVQSDEIEQKIKEFAKPFDLSQAPLIRVALLKELTDRHILMLDMHHIITDGVSTGILIEEFARLYAGEEIPPVKIQYKDYAIWQQGLITQGKLKKQEKYWLETLKGEIPLLAMPIDFPRPMVQSLEGKNVHFKVDKNIATSLKLLAKKESATLYMVLLAAFKTLLYRYTSQEIIIVGTPIAGRPHPDLERTIGIFVNTLALKSNPDADKTFRQFLNEVREYALKAYENQDYPFEKLVEKLDIQREINRNPLFDVMFVLENTDIGKIDIDLDGLRIFPYESENTLADFDFTLYASEVGEEINFNLEYNTSLFKSETMQSFADHLVNILNHVIINPDVKLGEVKLLSDEERDCILYEFNATTSTYPENMTLTRLFEEQVARTPDFPAVVFEDTQLTYDELNKRANQLARTLVAQGVKPDSFVGLMVEPSLEMIVGMFAILKAGAGYLPLDAKYPIERLKFMIDDCKVETLLTQTQFAGKCTFVKTCILVDQLDHYGTDYANLAIKVNTTSLAYIIYTSGTTGMPKGVMIEHRSVVNLVYSQQKRFGMNETDRVLQFSSITFDASVEQIFISLASGAALVLIAKDILLDGKKFEDYVIKHEVTHIHSIPSFLQTITPKEGYHFRRMVSGGDLCLGALVRKWQQRCDFYNEYGPTETTVTSIMFQVRDLAEDDETVLIGKPIDNTFVYILDKNKRPVPIGVSGELYIGGAGIAREYYNQPKLTGDRFLSNPFILGEKIYRTGDVARWRRDGNIEFIGRADYQVKIRGFRIEPGDIEHQLSTHPKIKAVVVVAKDDEKGEKALFSYYVAEKKLHGSILREYLEEKLPEYMIPAYFVQLDQLPLTANGKIDRNSLVDLDLIISDLPEYVAPRSMVEEKLVQIWQQVLGIQRPIGITENFFELGGHSLRATALIAKIHKELNVKIPLLIIFKTKTIAELAKYIQSATKNIYSSIQKIEEREHYPLSSAQKRMYFLQQFDPDSTHYNMPTVLLLEGIVDKERLTSVLQNLVNRHEAFRNCFTTVNEIPVQIIHSKIDVYLKEYEASEESVARVISKFIKPFDLSQAPLWRAGLIKVADEKHILIVDIHHIISDGTSTEIIARDFTQLYAGNDLPKLKIQYKDYAFWQQKILDSEEIQKQENFWLEQFAQEIPELNLPTDYPRPIIQSFEGKAINFVLNSELTRGLHKLVQQTGVTMYMLLLAIYNTLLAKYSGQTDIVVGSSVSGRNHDDLENVVGMFVNPLAMRNYPKSSKIFAAFLSEVKENALQAYANQDYQFEDLVERLDLKRNLGRNPLFDTVFDLHYNQAETDIDNLKLSPYPFATKAARFDLEFNLMEANHCLKGSIVYCTNLFKEATVQRMAIHFINIVQAVVQNVNIQLGEIDILSESEKVEIIEEFNNTEWEFGEKTILELFASQVQECSTQIAIKFADQQLTYAELDQRANQFANYLISQYNLGPDSLVGIYMKRSHHMAIAILGVMKAGVAYVPLDPAYPQKRIEQIVKDSQLSVMISEKQLVQVLNNLQWECENFSGYLCLDTPDIDSIADMEKDALKYGKDMWNYIGKQSDTEIEGAGWVNSYTGQQFSEVEMREYADNSLFKLKPYLNNKSRVLEIGCASGITMYAVAPQVDLYYGTDLSSIMIEKNRQRVAKEKLDNIVLTCMSADEIDQITEQFDIIIINSVIQYFLGHNYLKDVLRKAIQRLNNQGIIFIGDIRDQDLKEEFKQSVLDFKCQRPEYHSTSNFDELFISKDYFTDLSIEWPEIAEVEFSKKIYTIENELTRYRYDLIYKIDHQNPHFKQVKKRKYQHGSDVLAQYSYASPERRPNPGDLAYVIYTSGSTGNPKGAMVEHLGMLNHMYAKINDLQLNEKSIIAQNASHCFDISVWQFFVALLVGGTTKIYDNDLTLQIDNFMEQVIRDRITILEVVPSYLAVMLDSLDMQPRQFPDLQYLLVTGEEVKHDLVKRWFDKYAIKVVNAYGPTEASDDITHHIMDFVPESGAIPIGKTLQNLRIYIVDKNMQLCPIGVKGEICVSGIGVGRGYWNDPTKTNQVFMIDPFRKNEKVRMYKTGDLGRWRADGIIEFFGRIDYQVKIRGFRIELGEIETYLRKDSQMKDVVVVDRTLENRDKVLCAYYVADMEMDTDELVNNLAESLPAYMIPTYFIKLDKIPLNHNGKTDRKALPKPEGKVSTKLDYTPPGNKLEEKLVEIWQAVLGKKEPIGIHDNFFDLGGHSLKATMVVAKIHKELNAELPIAEMFTNPTIAGTANYLQNMAIENMYADIAKAEEKEYYPLSSAQKRMYFVHSLDPHSVSYNVPNVMLLKGELDYKRLEKAFGDLVQRHESLRTCFITIDGMPMQKIEQVNGVAIEYMEVAEESVDMVINQFIQPFDLSTAPLFRIGLIKLAPQRHILLVDMHHIITDGVSVALLTREVSLLYAGASLPELRIQYKDYSEWQQQMRETHAFKSQEEYWLNRFYGEISVLNLSTDFARPLIPDFTGKSIYFTIDKEVTAKLNNLARENNASLYMVLLAAYNVLLHKYTGQTEIIVGSPIAGRPHSDLENVIGMFVNTLAMLNHPEGDKTFLAFLQEVRHNALAGYKNQDYQFDELVEKLNIKRNSNRNPLFDTMLILQNIETKGIEMEELTLRHYRYENQISKFDIVFQVIERTNTLDCEFVYNINLFEEATIDLMKEEFLTLLELILKDPLQKIDEIDLQQTIDNSGEQIEDLLLDFDF
ncbi:MAG: amino acid adenylation domain-containing protein [Halanaerobiales bacterium]|nr:amino acid adenylation domain-containing protein [Halanaerobiales bacterium]